MYDGLVSVVNTSFQGFGVPQPVGYAIPRPFAGAFGPAMYDNRWAVDPRNISIATTFDAGIRAAQAEIFFRPKLTPPGFYPSGIHHTILNDKTGSVIGVAGVAYPIENTNLAQYGLPANHAQHGTKELGTSAAPFDQPFAQVVLYHHDTIVRGALDYGSTGSEIAEANFIPEIVEYWAGPHNPVKDTNITMLAWNVVTGSGGVQAHHVVQLPPPMTIVNGFRVLVTGGHPGGVLDLEIPFSRSGTLTASMARDYGQTKGVASVPEVFTLNSYHNSTGTCFYRPSSTLLHLRVVLKLTTDPDWSATPATVRYGSHFSGGAVYVKF